MIKLKIDPEFRDKIPRPSDEEVEQLEKNILRDGRITDPIFTWHGFIVDGHTRYGIMQKHPDIDFNPIIEELDDLFSEKDEVIVWMCERQTGRRNITSQVRKMLADIAYEATCRLRGGSGANRYKSTEDLGRTSVNAAEQIADQFKMSVPHVKHAVRFGRGVRAIEEQAPGTTKELMEGKAKVSDATVESFPSASEEEQKEIISALRESRSLKTPKKSSGWTAEDRKNRKEIEDIVADMYDPSTVPEFTLEFLIEDIHANGGNYINLLRNTLADRSNLLTEENRPPIAEAISDIIHEIIKIKEMVLA